MYLLVYKNIIFLYKVHLMILAWEQNILCELQINLYALNRLILVLEWLISSYLAIGIYLNINFHFMPLSPE